MPYMSMLDSTALYYEDKGSGQPIVLIHGWTGDHWSWAMTTAHFVQKGYRVISYDHRGHGASDRPKTGYTMQALAQDLETLMSGLGLKDVLLVGWSMGAHVLFNYVMQYGCARLKKAVVVDMSPKLITDDTWPHGLYHGKYTHQDNLDLLHMIEADYDAFAYDFFGKTMPVLMQNKDMMEQTVKGARGYPAYVAIPLMIEMTRTDYREEVAKITVPTLLMYGDPGSLYGPGDAQALHEKIPNSRLCPMAGGSHMFPLEMPDKFHNEMEAFFAE